MKLLSNLSKYRLWKGQPLLGTFRLAAEASDLATPEDTVRDGFLVTNERPAVLLTPCEDRTRIQTGRFIDENLPPGVIALDTTDLEEGAYEVLVAVGSEQVSITEMVWILERETYEAMVKDEAREPLERLPSISATSELRQTLQAAAMSVYPELRPRFKLSFSSEIPIPGSAVEWTARTIFEALRYVGPFGLIEPEAYAVIQKANIQMGVEARLEYPVPLAVLKSLYDERLSEVHQLNAAREMENFDVSLSFDYRQAKIAVRQSLPEAERTPALV